MAAAVVAQRKGYDNVELSMSEDDTTREKKKEKKVKKERKMSSTESKSKSKEDDEKKKSTTIPTVSYQNNNNHSSEEKKEENKKEDVPKSNEEIRKEVSVKVGPPVPEPASTAVPASDSSQMKSKLVLAKNPAAKGRGDKPKSTGCCSIL